MLPPKLRNKKLRKRCAHCTMKIKNVVVTLSYVNGSESEELVFCCADCMIEKLYDDDINDRINRAVRKEQNWLYKQICNRCRRKII